VKPELLQTSRKIKHIFTGILDSKVSCNPHFGGLEQDLLRCQLARIMNGTTLVPNEYLKVNDGDEAEVQEVGPNAEEGWKSKANDDVSKAEAWTYYNANILVGGKVRDPKYDGLGEMEDGPAKEIVEKEKAADPYIGRLKPLNEDTDKEESEGGEKLKWRVTQEGGKDKFNLSADASAFNAETGIGDPS